jgi:glycosyltransferase involved in cell wall biosynthesis
MDSPLITVVIPVRNGSNFIRTAIESVLCQTYQAVRVFVSDNCSEDDTESIVRAYQATDNRIMYVRHPENIGMLNNFNFCLRNIKTPYAVLLPHDDYFCSDTALEKALAIIQQSASIATVYSHMKFVDDWGQTIAIKRYKDTGLANSEVLLRQSIITTRNMYGLPVLIRSSAMARVEFDERFTYAGDVEWSYAIAHGQNIYRIDEVLIANRFHGGNATPRIAKFANKQFRLLAEKYGITLTKTELFQNMIYAPLVVIQKMLFFRWLALRKLFRGHTSGHHTAIITITPSQRF